jgi:hypothetical protein
LTCGEFWPGTPVAKKVLGETHSDTIAVERNLMHARRQRIERNA